MKPSLLVLSSALVSALVAAVLVIAIPPAASPPVGSARLAAAPGLGASSGEGHGGAARAPSSDRAELEAEVARLRDEVLELRARLLLLESERRPVEPLPALAAAPEPTGEADRGDLTDEARDAILDLIQQDRDRRGLEREETLAVVRRDLAARRAAEVARELGLAADQEETLATILSEESERMASLRDDVRRIAPGPEMVEVMRAGREEVRLWKDAQLSLRFGDPLSAEIRASERAGGPFGRAFGAGRRDRWEADGSPAGGDRGPSEN